jgi:protein-export membrane protein SecD
MRVWALVILILGAALGWFVYSAQMKGFRPLRLGLDLSGGTQLVYRADTHAIPDTEVADSMASLRDTIERRVNLFGVAEPIVQTEQASVLSGTREERLIVELPGITDVQQAVTLIGLTPVLEFRLMKVGAQPTASSTIDEVFEPAVVTGKNLTGAQLQFQGSKGLPTEPVVVLSFDSAGAKLFADLTAQNVGRQFGIFLDGQPISVPVIREAIPDGTAVISGNFTAESAKELARNLNFGALPVPINLISTQSVSGTLGGEAVKHGIVAGLWGVALVALFMIVWYRIPGLIASVALLLYVLAILALFEVIPVTLSAAGIAAFILSIGMAVDANILIFERMKEEMHSGKSVGEAAHDGFTRAWNSIRDSNISSIITAIILFWFGTSLVKGFALVFGLGVLVSMLTAISVSRTLLFALGVDSHGRIAHFLFGGRFRHQH